ncbi:hypothetical protein V376_02552, partial [Staphylococcus aureus S29036]
FYTFICLISKSSMINSILFFFSRTVAKEGKAEGTTEEE